MNVIRSTFFLLAAALALLASANNLAAQTPPPPQVAGQQLEDPAVPGPATTYTLQADNNGPTHTLTATASADGKITEFTMDGKDFRYDESKKIYYQTNVLPEPYYWVRCTKIGEGKYRYEYYNKHTRVLERGEANLN